MISVHAYNIFWPWRSSIRSLNKSQTMGPSLSGLVSSTMATSGLGVLTTNPNAPVVTKSPMQTHLLHTLNILAKALIEKICILVAGFSIFDIPLPIEHVRWNLELERIPNNSNNLVDLVCGEFTCTLVMSISHFLQMMFENRL